MKDITLISCSYNTPHVTTNMLKSFINFHPECDILICENSTDEKTADFLKKSDIPFIRNKSGLHGPSVDLLFKKITTKYALLVDTDVIFLKNHDDIFQQVCDMNISLMGDIEGDRGGKRIHKRVHPWHCFINIEEINKNKINFYDSERMLKKESVIYDVGSSFFEDCKKNKLRIADFKGGNVYYKHYEGMSWRVNKFNDKKKSGDIDNVNDATHDNDNLYRYGVHINQIYSEETTKFLHQKLKYGNTKN